MQQAGEGGPGEAGQEEVEVGGRASLAEEPAEETNKLILGQCS